MKTFSFYSNITRARDTNVKARAEAETEAKKERKYSVTKTQFSRAVKAMLNSVISIPDELWGTCFPTVTVRVGDTEAFIGIRPVTPETGKLMERGDDED